MARVPVVGPKQVHTVSLSPQLRKLLHHRAAAEARREAAPVLAQDREEFATPKAEYRTQKAADEAAAGLLGTSLSQSLAGLKGSGLEGRYLHQAISNLTGSAAAAKESIPYQLAEAGEARAKGLSEAHSQLAGDRASLLSNIASGFNSLLSSARSSGSEAIKVHQEHEAAIRKEQRENHEGKAEETQKKAEERAEDTAITPKGQNAYTVALNGYKYLTSHFGEEIKDSKGEVTGILKPPKTAQDWVQFAKHVEEEAGHGTNYVEAESAVEELRKQLARLRHQAKLPVQGSEVVPPEGE